MGKIFYLIGKSASGKDSIFKRLLADADLKLKTVTMYTTRPSRDGEKDGVEYFFSSTAKLEELNNQNLVIECRTYHTIHGPWSYFTVDDGQINLSGKENYLMMGTLESFQKMRQYFGKTSVVPLYIYVEPGERLTRALEREKRQSQPRYEELCRRFLADEEDFKEENLINHEIVNRYENQDMEACYWGIKMEMVKIISDNY